MIISKKKFERIIQRRINDAVWKRENEMMVNDQLIKQGNELDSLKKRVEKIETIIEKKYANKAD